MIGKLVVVAAVALAQAAPAQAAGGWVCGILDSNPTESGVWEMVIEAASRGYRTESDARQIALTVQSQCPEYIPLLIEWAENNG